jgi:hypothetical protein
MTMEALKLKKIAERVTLLQSASTGELTPVTLYKGKRKKKKNNEISDCRGPCKALGRKMGACSLMNRCCSPF